MLRSFIDFFYFKFKKRHFKLDENVSDLDLVRLVFLYFYMFFVGLIKGYNGVFFGRNVKMICKRKISIGSGGTIGDFSKLNGIGINGITLGKSCTVGSYSTLQVSGTLSSLGIGICIGDNVGIGEFAHIGGAGGVDIGNDTIIGSYFSVHPENHNFLDHTLLIRNQGVNRKGICIGSNCWIGAKVTVLDGSIIGDGCVVAAGAVVNGVFPDNVIIGGVPAKILKER